MSDDDPFYKQGPQSNPSNVLNHRDPPEPVTPENPLVGLETRVLRNWLENSPNLRKRSQNPKDREDLENAARLAVHQAFAEELELRAQGMTQEQAEEFTRPAMWTPPTWPTMPPSPSPAANPRSRREHS